jgi:hypothetical protein
MGLALCSVYLITHRTHSHNTGSAAGIGGTGGASSVTLGKSDGLPVNIKYKRLSLFIRTDFHARFNRGLYTHPHYNG